MLCYVFYCLVGFSFTIFFFLLPCQSIRHFYSLLINVLKENSYCFFDEFSANFPCDHFFNVTIIFKVWVINTLILYLLNMLKYIMLLLNSRLYHTAGNYNEVNVMLLIAHFETTEELILLFTNVDYSISVVSKCEIKSIFFIKLTTIFIEIYLL